MSIDSLANIHTPSASAPHSLPVDAATIPITTLSEVKEEEKDSHHLSNESLKRAFVDLYRDFSCLKSFCVINYTGKDRLSPGYHEFRRITLLYHLVYITACCNLIFGLYL